MGWTFLGSTPVVGRGGSGIRLTDGAYAGSLVDLQLETLICWRAADLAARVLLVVRLGSVFPIAPRMAWQEQDYWAATGRCQER